MNSIKTKETLTSLNLVENYLKEKKYNEAIGETKKILEIDSNSTEALIYLGKAYYNLKNYENAILEFKKALELNSSNIESLIGLGFSYYCLKEYDKAILKFKKVLELDNCNINVLIYLAISYYSLKDYENSISEFKKALELDSSNIKSLIGLALSYKNLKDYENTILEFKKLLELDIDNKLKKSINLALFSIYKLKKNKFISDEYYVKSIDFPFFEYIRENFNEQEVPCIFRLFTSVISFRNLNLAFNVSKNLDCRIGHYTKTSILPNLFPPKNELGKLRLNSIAYMNDPTEGEIFLELLSRISFDEKNYSNDDIIATRKFINNIYLNEKDINTISSENKIFLTSFTTSIDDSLPMWVQYGDLGQGCCIVLESNFFDKEESTSLTINNTFDINCEFNNTYCLYSIKYIDLNNKNTLKNFSNDLKEIFYALIDLKKIYECYESDDLKNKLKIVIQNILNQIRFLFKNKHYEHENELRVIKFENNPKNIEFDSDNFSIPHIYINIEKQLKVNEIILGPKVQNSLEIATYLYSKNIKKISKSQIKFQ